MHIEITKNAIDEASNRCRGIWAETRLKGSPSSEDEGLWTWLERITREALTRGEELASGKIRYNGMKLTVETKVEDLNNTTTLWSVSRVRK